jgi:hypothetical protein
MNSATAVFGTEHVKVNFLQSTAAPKLLVNFMAITSEPLKQNCEVLYGDRSWTDFNILNGTYFLEVNNY